MAVAGDGAYPGPEGLVVALEGGQLPDDLHPGVGRQVVGRLTADHPEIAEESWLEDGPDGGKCVRIAFLGQAEEILEGVRLSNRR